MTPAQHHELMAKTRRETIRWLLLVTLDVTRPDTASVTLVKPVIAANFSDVTEVEIKRELDYLEERELVSIEHDALGLWRTKLTRHGVDVVEYTVEVDAGIARPRKDF